MVVLNVKLGTKPSVQTKVKQVFPKLSATSPYYQEQPDMENSVPARRIQSATTFRNVTQGKAKAKTVHRKQSEPIICTQSIYSQRITTLQPKAPSSSSVSSSKGRIIVSQPNPIVSTGVGDTGWNRVRPLSASSTSNSNNSDVFLPDIHRHLILPVEETLVSTELESRTDINFEPTQRPRDKNTSQFTQLGNDDEILLSESDNLLQDVVCLCDEIGLESSLIDNLRNKRNNSFCSSENGSDKIQIEMDENEILNSTINPDNKDESITTSDGEIREKIIREISKKVHQFSRPNSAHSQFSIKITHGNGNGEDNSEEIYCKCISPVQVQNQAVSRLISTLRLIEEEEKSGCVMSTHFGGFFRHKLSPNNSAPPSRPSSRSSVTPSCNMYSAGDINTQIQTPRFHSKDTTPRLPPIPIPGLTTPNDLHLPNMRSTSKEYCYDEDQQVQVGRSPRIPFVHESDSYRVVLPIPKSQPIISMETTDEKARSIFSFLDEVEKSDRDILFNLKFDSSQMRGGLPSSRHPRMGTVSTEFPASIMDTLIRKGSVELAREVILLERKVEEISQNISILEETLMSQRELNVRNIKNSQKDLKKRLKIQQEEFEMALSRHQTFVDQLIVEKRGLQDKCEKVLKESKESEQRYQQQMKSLQEKHLDELKRIRKLQDNAEKTRKQKWVGTKTQEIRDMTVKGLEPEVQRIIQRHQQEMSEMRAWHADELRETEERYARKQTMHLQELRDTFNREKDEACRRERELAQKRFDSDLNRLNDEFETQKRRLIQEMQEERERFILDESKLKDLMQENVRKAQIKGEVQAENQKQEYDNKIANLEKRHDSELKSLKDVYENQRESFVSSQTKKLELAVAEKENILHEQFHIEKDKEIKEKEKKLKDEFKKLWMEEEEAQDARIKRMQDKFQLELTDLEASELELKQKFSRVKSEVLGKEEIIFSLKTTLGLKEKQVVELNDSNMKMLEERINLTSVIRREFTTQIDALDEECRSVKSAVLELKAKQKLDLESHQIELEKVHCEKDLEIEKIGLRVKHALLRKEEAIQEFQKQLEKAQIRINHLEQLLEQQRKDFVSSITSCDTTNPPTKKKVI